MWKPLSSPALLHYTVITPICRGVPMSSGLKCSDNTSYKQRTALVTSRDGTVGDSEREKISRY